MIYRAVPQYLVARLTTAAIGPRRGYRKHKRTIPRRRDDENLAICNNFTFRCTESGYTAASRRTPTPLHNSGCGQPRYQKCFTTNCILKKQRYFAICCFATRYNLLRKLRYMQFHCMRYDMAPYHITCRRHISRRRHIASNGHIADPSGSISLSRLRRDKP